MHELLQRALSVCLSKERQRSSWSYFIIIIVSTQSRLFWLCPLTFSQLNHYYSDYDYYCYVLADIDLWKYDDYHLKEKRSHRVSWYLNEQQWTGERVAKRMVHWRELRIVSIESNIIRNLMSKFSLRAN